jgi:hypothetical protein
MQSDIYYMLLLRIFFPITTETARASSVSDQHSLFADPYLDAAFLVNADPYPALKMKTDLDPDPGEMLSNIF